MNNRSIDREAENAGIAALIEAENAGLDKEAQEAAYFSARNAVISKYLSRR
jgi:hypothetical protein